MTGRSVPIWRGRTPDAKVPPKVRQRIFDRYGGKCYLSGILIAGKEWEIEHIVPLSMSGSHSEDNMAPVLKDCHKIKSAAEAKIRAKADRVARKASGSRDAPKRPIQSRGLPSSPKAKPERKPSLEPRKLYA